MDFELVLCEYLHHAKRVVEYILSAVHNEWWLVDSGLDDNHTIAVCSIQVTVSHYCCLLRVIFRFGHKTPKTVLVLRGRVAV